MKYNTQIRIWSQDQSKQYILDLKDAEPISLNFSFTDIKDFATKTAWSRPFRIPLTETNAEVFGFMHEWNVVQSSFNPKKKLRAQVLVESMPIMSGYVQFKASYKQQGQDVEYDIIFFGDVLDFLKKFGDAEFKTDIAPKLQDQYPLIMSFSQLSAWQNSDVQISLTDRGNRWVGLVDDATTRSIYAWDMQDVIKFNDLTPFVSARFIFDTIMEIAGCKVNQTESATLLGELDRMFIPWTSKANTIQSLGDVETARFRLVGGTNYGHLDNSSFLPLTSPSGSVFFVSSLPLIYEEYDPGGNVNTNAYLVPFNGNYNLKARVTSEVDTVAPLYVGFTLGFKRFNINTGITELILDNVNAQMTYFNNAGGNILLNTPITANTSININDYEGLYTLNAGDVVEPVAIYNYVWSSASAPAMIPWGGMLTFHEDCFFKCDLVEKASYGNSIIIDWTANAPDKFKLIDFMKSLIQMYNLVIVPSKIDNTEYSFIPIMEYLAGGEYKDWTQKMNLLKDVVVKTIADYQAVSNLWTYKESNDFHNNVYKVQGNRIYGRLELIDPDNDFATKENKVEIQFAPTPCALIDGTDYPIPKFWNEQGAYVVPIPRILYLTENTINIHMLDDVNNIVFNGVLLQLFSHYTNTTPTIADDDLNFGQEIPLHNTTSTPYKTLYNRFWNDYVIQLYSPESRILEAFFDLDLSDIFTFKYNDRIFIQDSYWRVIDISDYQIGTTESTKVVLMKIVNVPALCINTPDNYINVDGSVPFLDQDGNPTAPTQECCGAYGYTWNGFKCYAILPDGNAGGKPKVSGKEIKIVQTLSSADAKNQVGVVTTNNDIQPLNDALLVNATNSVIESNNSGSVVSGTNHIVEANTGSVVVAGDSAAVKNTGSTTGVAGDYRGEFQYGKMGLQAKGNLPTSGSTIAIYVDGVDGCKMPDDCVWSVRVQLTLAIVSGGITDTLSGEYAFSWQSVAGVCSEVGNNTLSEITTYAGMSISFFNSSPSAGTMTLRFSVTGAPSYPIDVAVVGALNYTQYSYV
jgi:hypothetical protein